MCTVGRNRRRASAPPALGQIPDPTEVLQTPKGGAIDPHTRLKGYTMSTMLGISQVWFVTHHVGHVMKTLRSGRLEELHRRMKRNPHVLDVKVCRAVLWWNILGEAMDAAREAENRRSRRREMRQLVVALAVSQRRAGRAERSVLSPDSPYRRLLNRALSPIPLREEGMDESYSLPPQERAGIELLCPLSSTVAGVGEWHSRAPFGGGTQDFRSRILVKKEMENSGGVSHAGEGIDFACPPPSPENSRGGGEEGVNVRLACSSPVSHGEVREGDCGCRSEALGSREKRKEDVVEMGDRKDMVHLDEAAVLRRVYDYL